MRKLHCLLMGILLLIGQGLFAQTTEVTGKITDPTGSPIPNITIRIKGTRTGTSADMAGTFTIKVPANTVLIVSGIGYEGKEIKVGSLTSLSIRLNPDSKSLSEVVVTGTGTATSKRHLGISVESVSGDKLPPAPTASIDQALVGKIAGAQISSVSGDPGAPVNILLRGINTVQGGTKPLILIDGIEVRSTDIGSLDLTNIERVEVVQGAASATIYGAQGANGVIQIFTKKGKIGAPVINFSTSFSANNYTNKGHVYKSALHPYTVDANNNVLDYRTGQPIVLQADGTLLGISYKYGGPNRYGILDPRNINNTPYNGNLKYVDQFKQVFQTGTSFNNGINISGATDKSDYALNVSNSHSVSPVLKNGSLDRTNLSANLGAELFKGFKIRSMTELVYSRSTLVPGLGAPGGYLYGKGNNAGTSNGGGNGYGIYGFMNTSPFFDLKAKLPDGTYPNYQGADFLSVNSYNPYYLTEYASGLSNKIDIIQNFDANYRVNKFVELDAKYGINYRTETDKWTYLNQLGNANATEFSQYDGFFTNGDGKGEIDNWTYNSTFQNFIGSAFIRTDFQKDFNSRLPITTSTQISFDYRKNLYNEYDTYGVDLGQFPPFNMSSTGSQAVAGYNKATNTAGDYKEPFITYGYLVNQVIDFGNFGGISGGFRSDYSSAFGGGHAPFTFPRGSAYILPSAFEFWSPLAGVIPYFKLRGAYGEAGIQPQAFDRYPTLTSGNVGSALAYSNGQIAANPNLQVEVSKEFEGGTDFTISPNRNGVWFSSINVSATYWNRTSRNVIYDVSQAISGGAPLIKNNALGLASNGIQFSLNIPVIRSKNFTWDFTNNFGHEISKVKTINGPPIILTTSAGSTALVLNAGAKIGQLYGFKALTSTSEKRLDGTSYFDQSTSGTVQKVDGRLVDTASKAILFSDDAYPLGDPNPKFNTSFINAFTYKDFLSFSFQIDWVYGGHLYNQTKEWMYRDGISGDFDKKVTINGQTAAFTAYHASAYYGGGGAAHGPANDGTKDYFLEGSSFGRLRNVSIGLDFARLYNIKGIKKLQLVFSGRNLATLTKYSGFDPEVSSGAANSAFDRGVDHNSTPNTKSYQVGLNVGF